MCGRYTLSASATKIVEFFALDSELTPVEPRYNIAPTDGVLVVGEEKATGARGAVRRRWGLVPSWAKSVGRDR